MAAPLEVQRIQSHLKAGKSFAQLGATYLDAGCYRTVFKLGDYVIKGDNDCCEFGPHPFRAVFHRLEARRLGLKLAPTWKAKKWLIQPYYTPLTDTEYFALGTNIVHSLSDFHSGNLGKDKDGVVYAFDW